MRTREIVEHLQDVPVFASCSERQLRRIVQRGAERTYEPGAIVCEEGKRGDEFLVVLEGSAVVRRGRRSVGTLRAGDHFGEIALLQSLLGPRTRTATVEATSPLRCFVLSSNDFKSVIYEANIAVSLLYAMAERVAAQA